MDRLGGIRTCFRIGPMLNTPVTMAGSCFAWLISINGPTSRSSVRYLSSMCCHIIMCRPTSGCWLTNSTSLELTWADVASPTSVLLTALVMQCCRPTWRLRLKSFIEKSRWKSVREWSKSLRSSNSTAVNYCHKYISQVASLKDYRYYNVVCEWENVKDLVRMELFQFYIKLDFLELTFMIMTNIGCNRDYFINDFGIIAWQSVCWL